MGHNKKKNKDNKIKIIVVLLIVILVLIIIRIGISSYNSSKIDDDEETEKKEKLTFSDIVEDWGVLYQENKTYQVENVTIGSTNGTLSIEYNYDNGVKTLVIRHDDNLLVSDERNSDEGDYVLTYLGVYNDEYLIWGEKSCGSYYDENTVCSPYDVVSLHVLNYEMNELVEKIDEYYIYDVVITNDTVELKTLANDYGSGIWSCDKSTGDIQRVYSMIIDKNKIVTQKISSITFSQYCENAENIIVDWE